MYNCIIFAPSPRSVISSHCRYGHVGSSTLVYTCHISFVYEIWFWGEMPGFIIGKHRDLAMSYIHVPCAIFLSVDGELSRDLRSYQISIINGLQRGGEGRGGGLIQYVITRNINEGSCFLLVSSKLQLVISQLIVG